MASKSRGPLEASVEDYLVRCVRAAGGHIIKIQRTAHWPDRLVLLPLRKPALVELKRPKGGRLSEGQKELRLQLREIGHDVHILWTKDMVDEFIQKDFDA